MGEEGALDEDVEGDDAGSSGASLEEDGMERQYPQRTRRPPGWLNDYETGDVEL